MSYKILFQKSIVAFVLVFALTAPVFVFAQVQEKSGAPRPGTFFYLVDIAFEKVGLFFTFNPEKKAKKALKYADKRLAQIQLVDEEEAPESVMSLIENYEKNIALAVQKSKEVTDKEKAESLFISIADNTSKNQEVLSAVLLKVPEEAKDAIERAIEASRKNQEEALEQIAELKKEIGELREEIQKLKEELKEKDEEKQAAKKETEDKDENETDENEIEALKKEIQKLEKEIKQPETKKTKIENVENKIVTLPNGAVVEMDKSGNILKIIKDVSQQFQEDQGGSLKISIPNISVEVSSVKFEFETNLPTNAKLFLTQPDGIVKIFSSISGVSTKHIVDVSNLISGTTYQYLIEAIVDAKSIKKMGSFITKPQIFTIEAIKNPASTSNTRPYLRINSNRTFSIQKLVFLNDESYCPSRSAIVYISMAEMEAKQDSTDRFTFADVPLADYYRISYGVTNADGQPPACVNEGVRLTLLGSESAILDERGQKINFKDVVLQNTFPEITKYNDLTVETNKYKVVVSDGSLTDWDSVVITANYIEDGGVRPATYTFIAPEKQQTSEKNTFIYKPTFLGNHTISVKANGFTKSIIINVVGKFNPEIIKKLVCQPDVSGNCSQLVDIPIYLSNNNYNDPILGRFELTDADESFRISQIKFETDLDNINLLFLSAGNVYASIYGGDAPIHKQGTTYSIRVRSTANIFPGTHIFTINEMYVVGNFSGAKRQVLGLPMTFNFEVK